jgi:xanthine dehydrogenase YagR molybdenum-binding subunit
MKFDTPAGTNPIDRLRVVGHPTDRIDGPLKTTGTASYAYEHHAEAPDAAYGYVVGAGIAKGRIATIDTRRAEAAPGVLAVVTAETAGTLGKGRFNTARLLAGPDIQHYHQAIALVVAQTFEEARAAAALVEVGYSPDKGRFDLAAAKALAKAPEAGFGGPPDTAVGDFDGAFASAEVTVDETYTTPDQSHAMMEPHASIAAWDGDSLTVWTSNQMIAWSAGDVAATLDMPPEKVRLISPYIGGGFGGKLFVRADAVLAALGARAVGRPVKVALQRPLMINNTTHRPATHQRVRIGARRDGTIVAIGHESWSGDLEGGGPETAVNQTRLLYAGEHRMTRTRLAVLDLPEGNAMRAPGEAPGMMALEIAMDEMAEKLGLDPVEFRIRNDTRVAPDNPAKPQGDDPQAKAGQKPRNNQVPFSQRRLVECLKIGAERFGWHRRSAPPAAIRDGRWLVGMGVAQTAAEMMGVPLDRVTVRLGDSSFPVSAGSGGQWGANSATAGVYAACTKLREAVAQRFGFDPGEAVFEDGMVKEGNRSVPLAEAGRLEAEDAMEYGDLAERFQQSTFGAHYVEVAVDAATGESRIRRMLAVCAAGRILNPKSARSQVIGAMTMGAGAALMEELAVDERLGFFVNHDLAGYEVPVHADIPHQEVIFLDETDPMSSPMKAKGVGELGICGVGAAVANAIYNATGVRIRDYPITLDKLIERLPAA